MLGFQMYRLQPSPRSIGLIRYLSGLFVILAIQSAIGIQPAQSQSIFDKLREMVSPPTNRGTANGRSRGGSIRGGCLVANRSSQPETNLVALMPQNNLATTLEAHPTLWFYLPKFVRATEATDLPAIVGQFMVLDDGGKPLLKKPLQLQFPDSAGFARLALPKEVLLVPGRRYQWFFSLMCDPTQPAKNPQVNGWVERLKPIPKLEAQLKSAKASDRPLLYIQSGVWSESVMLLADQRSQNRDLWLEFLDQLGLAKTVESPIADLRPIELKH